MQRVSFHLEESRIATGLEARAYRAVGQYRFNPDRQLSESETEFCSFLSDELLRHPHRIRANLDHPRSCRVYQSSLSPCAGMGSGQD